MADQNESENHNAENGSVGDIVLCRPVRKVLEKGANHPSFSLVPNPSPMAKNKKLNQKQTLTKDLILQLPAGTFVSVGVLGAIYVDSEKNRRIGASWLGTIAETNEGRLAQWNDIKACRANGRAISIMEGPGAFSEESKWFLSAKKVSDPFSLAPKTPTVTQSNGNAEGLDEDVPF